MAKAVRIFRMLRILRLLRITRMVKFLKDCLASCQGERVSIAANLVKCMCLILWPVHMIACLWFGISEGLEDGWVRNMHDASASSLWDWYALSLHWSSCQFFGSSDVHPWNTRERFFAVSSLVFGFVAATCFVSSLTSSMTQLHLLSGRQAALVSTLRKHLVSQGISSRLTYRLQLNAQEAFKEV